MLLIPSDTVGMNNCGFIGPVNQHNAISKNINVKSHRIAFTRHYSEAISFMLQLEDWNAHLNMYIFGDKDSAKYIVNLIRGNVIVTTCITYLIPFLGPLDFVYSCCEMCFCRLEVIPGTTVQAPVPLNIFRSNSKFEENSKHSSVKYTRPITTIFCTRHDSVTVVTCAKYRCDRSNIFETRVF